MSKSRELLGSFLLKGLSDLYENQWPTLCDLTINCANEEKVLAHKLVLAIHSDYFSAHFHITLKRRQYHCHNLTQW